MTADSAILVHSASPSGGRIIATAPSSVVRTPRPPRPRIFDATVFERQVRRVFDGNAPFTIGVEEELLLLELDSQQLAPVAPVALRLLGCDGRFASELRASQLELVTPVCCTVADAVREQASVRSFASHRLRGLARIAAVGAHPTSRDAGPITATRRYAGIVSDHPQIRSRLLTCGLHVHVAVGGAERSLAVYNALRAYLPEIVSLGANAPFHEGLDTGLATVRPGLNRLLPRSGVPPAFPTWHSYADFCAWTTNGGAARDVSHQWWDIRLHPTHGTVEVRAADVQTRLEDTAALAALIHSLAFTLADRYDQGESLPVIASERIAENVSLAARNGVHGSLIEFTSGERVRTSAALSALADGLMPAARELGCGEELQGVTRMLRSGGGAGRQRDAVRAHGIDTLTDWLAAETTPQRPMRRDAGIALVAGPNASANTLRPSPLTPASPGKAWRRDAPLPQLSAA